MGPRSISTLKLSNDKFVQPQMRGKLRNDNLVHSRMRGANVNGHEPRITDHEISDARYDRAHRQHTSGLIATMLPRR